MIRAILTAAAAATVLAACAGSGNTRSSQDEILMLSEGVRAMIEQGGEVEAVLAEKDNASESRVVCRRERRTGSNLLIRRCYTRDEGSNQRDHNYVQWTQRSMKDSRFGDN